MKSFNQFITEIARVVGRVDLQNTGAKITKSELNQLEKFLDAMFAKANIDVEFTRHFLDRVNDPRNKRQITIEELRSTFTKTYHRYKNILTQSGVDWEAVIKDLQSDINVPFVMKWDAKNKELDLVGKTIMRKKGFRTSNKEFKV